MELRRAASAVALATATLLVAACGGDDDAGEPDSRFGSPDAAPAGPPDLNVARYRIRGEPDAISVGAGYAWVVDSSSGTLSRLNPRSERPILVEVAGFPTDVSADEEAAWLSLGDAGAVQRVTGTEGASAPVDSENFGFAIAAGEGAVWSMSPNTVERIEPASGLLTPTGDAGDELVDIAAGEGSVWVVNSEGVARLDPGDGSGLGVSEVPGAFAVATGESAAWVLGRDDRGTTVTRVGPDGSIEGEPVGAPGAVAVAAGLGYIWVATKDELVPLDPETGQTAGDPIPFEDPRDVAVGEGSVWIATGEEAVYRLTP